jgi:L-fuconolactonase
MIIDSHQHFWKYNNKDYDWMGDDMEILKNDFLPNNLQPILQSTGIKGTIAVQARQSLEETRWLLALAEENDFITGVVGWVDLCSDAVEVQLQEFSSAKKFCGVRHVLHDEPDDNYMLRDEFTNGIEKLREFNLTYDLLLFTQHLPIACDLVAKFPNQRFVLDHLAKPSIKDGEIDDWALGLKQLADYPNIYCKVSGMVTENHWESWQESDFTPYLNIVFSMFGWERVMFGSDWPVCTVAAEYAEVFGIIQNYLRNNDFSEQAIKAVLGGNAQHFYGIENQKG